MNDHPVDIAQHPVATTEGHTHPIGVYLKVWGYLFVLSTMSYLVDYFHFEGVMRWTLMSAFVVRCFFRSSACN